MLLRHLSFKTLLVASLFAVTLRPSLALVQTWWHLQQLSDSVNDSQQLSVAWSDWSHTFAEQGERFERSSRQWLALDEPTFADSSLQALQALDKLSDKLQQTDDAGMQAVAKSLHDWVGKSRVTLMTGDAAPAMRQSQLEGQYERLTALGQSLDGRVKQAAAERRQRWEANLRNKRQQADRMAIISLMTAIAGGFLLAHLLVRPLTVLRQKINRLARGERGQDWNMSAPYDLLQLANALSELDSRLKQLEEDKTSFFRHVSHELKTPLAAIQEASSLLHDQIPGPMNLAQQEIASITLANTRLLRQRVDTLLKQDAGKWLERPLTMERFALAGMLAEMEASLRPLLRQKRLSFEAVGDELPISADRERLRTILDNLVSNAIRFSPQDGIIKIEVTRRDGRCGVRVCDQGPGVPDGVREKIFDPFFTGPPPAGEVPGSGIGLTMVKTFAQLMGGDVACPAVAMGAQFYVWWPDGEPKGS